MLTISTLAEGGLVDFDWGSAIWILALFTILTLVLYKVAWKNVLAGLKAREDRIRKDIADAEAARMKAEQTLRLYDTRLAEAEQKVRDILDRAAADAEKIGTSIRMKAQQEAEESKEHATREIEAAKQTALTEIYAQTANLATSIAEKIIRRNLNADDQRDLVDQSLKQLQSVGHN
ncbi:MAG TPA: F0F1 ATP synthase subunit B [Tepidisphaeraceae bacterium]|jgi:F-type H+-transporting ATPase subunit b|nr:F0F1 ATP synthase subunit B [Tepidisphaeraceae bacterium]